MSAPRDLTKAQFRAALARGGFVAEGVLGYYRLPIEGQHVSVSILNATGGRRGALAYLHQQTAKYERQIRGPRRALAIIRGES